MGGRHRFVAITSAVLLTVGLLGAAVPSVAGAAEQPAVTLTSTSQTASWSGEFVAGAGFSLGGFAVGPTASLPDSCTPQFCDIVPVEVRLAEKTWQQRPGGLLVSIEARIESFDSLDLYVYGPDRALAASSVSVLSDEAAWIENPVNGTYTVVVVPASVASQPVVDGVFEPLEYRGFVEFARGVTVEREELNKGKPYTRQFVAFGLTEQRPAVELLPDLVPTTPRDFHIETTVGKGPDAGADRGLRHPPSCYPDEMLGLNEDEPNPGDGPLRCLRFDQGQHNVGDGPMELHV